MHEDAAGLGVRRLSGCPVSANRGTALNLVWASRVDDTTPHPDARLVLEALGLIDGSVVLPDDTRPIPLVDLNSGGGAGDDPNSLTTRRSLQAAESSRDRSHVPAGLRTLAPPAPAPVKPRRPVERVREPKPAKAPRAPQPRKPTPAPVAAVPKPRPSSVTAETKPRRPPGRPRKPIEHGTNAGAQQHIRHGVPIPDDDACGCRAAMRAAKADWQRKRRAAAARQAIAADLDQWFAAAQRSGHPAVRRAAGPAIAALLQLRVAMDDLARAERQRDGKAAS